MSTQLGFSIFPHIPATNTDYHETCLVNRNPRYGLEGTVVGCVTVRTHLEGVEALFLFFCASLAEFVLMNVYVFNDLGCISGL